MRMEGLMIELKEYTCQNKWLSQISSRMHFDKAERFEMNDEVFMLECI